MKMTSWVASPFQVLGLDEMLSLTSTMTFLGASILLAIAPGPDNIFVLTQSIVQGSKAGVVIALGLCSGLVFHTLAVTLGVATIFQTSPFAFLVLKFVGGAYLLYLGWMSFRSTQDTIAISAGRNLIPFKKLYVRGIIMNVTNPKVSLFFLAFLPQFVDASRGKVGVQMASLGFVFILATILVFSSIALIAGQIGNHLSKSARAMKAINYLAGVVFIALAAKLVLG